MPTGMLTMRRLSLSVAKGNPKKSKSTRQKTKNHARVGLLKSPLKY
jgi:hypothetical protein